MAMKLTKKPVEVEGLRFTGTNHEECRQFCGDAWKQEEAGTPFIATKEGDMRVKPGAMVVKGLKGEFYAVDPELVEQTFNLPKEAGLESLLEPSLEYMTKKEREEAPASMWGMPRLKKIRLDSATHIRLGWDMINRVKGANDEDRAEARRRVLAAAKRHGIDTSDWTKGKKALEDFQNANVVDPNFVMDALPYLFNQLSEEAGELVQASCRAQRFGIDSIDPFQKVSNRDKVREEYTDVQVMMKLIEEEMIARGYQPLLVGAGGTYFQERMAQRIESLKKEYTAGHFRLPGEFADQAQ